MPTIGDLLAGTNLLVGTKNSWTSEEDPVKETRASPLAQFPLAKLRTRPIEISPHSVSSVRISALPPSLHLYLSSRIVDFYLLAVVFDHIDTDPSVAGLGTAAPPKRFAHSSLTAINLRC